ncbi:L-rhamnose mutarotase [Novosphingobium flavum]|uniref:L-rhamnose mutarotase n=1 Tax=Novosphingobium flavum TaxID=1778672 RepID=A0A7X1FUD7_9SPHN|nr:L-rhamnose mutarotase [Novosphingobium flavum]MBC2667180.1 L-rhamnose mutarotase [Novosphingobium flavum]
MSVHAFRMQLKPGQIAEYRRRHDEIWPDLARLLKDAGISDYRIFVDPQTGALFAVLTLAPDNRRDELPGAAVMLRWWDYMADLMEVDETNRPREWPLHEVFHLP